MLRIFSRILFAKNKEIEGINRFREGKQTEQRILMAIRRSKMLWGIFASAIEDAPVMFDYRNNEICAWYQRGQTKDYYGVGTLIQRRKDDMLGTDDNCLIAVARKNTGEMIGEIVVMPNDDCFSLGYTFSYRHHRKRYAFEALPALIDSLHKRFPEWGVSASWNRRILPAGVC